MWFKPPHENADYNQQEKRDRQADTPAKVCDSFVRIRFFGG